MTAVTMAADVAAIRNEGRTFVRNGAIGHGDSFFHSRRLDVVEDLRRSFELRHRVYCEERGFLVAEDYPEGSSSARFAWCGVGSIACPFMSIARSIRKR